MDISSYSIDGDSISVSESSTKGESRFDLIKENEEGKNFIFKCPKCYEYARIRADFDKNVFYTFCNNQHKVESNSFNSFIENSIKDYNDILCKECQKSEEDPSNMIFCSKCYTFFCSNCKSKHIEKTSHTDYISLDKMNNYCTKHDELYQYFDNNKKKHLCKKCYDEKISKNSKYLNNVIELSSCIKYKETINENFNKAKENVKMLNNISRALNEWLQNLTNKIHNFLNGFKNYCELQYKIVSSLNYENNYEKYLNNFNVYFNYIVVNNEETDKIIKNINNTINSNYNKNSDIYKTSKFYIDLLDNLNNKDLNIESKKNILLQKDKKLHALLPPKFNNNINELKIENMDKNKYELKHTVKKIIPFNEEQYIVVGLESGKIRIYEEQKKSKDENNEKEGNEYLNKKLTIKVFENSINNLCELDKDIIIGSDITNNIKIIQIEDNLTKYSIIQELKLKENSGNANSITFLPIFSYYRNRHIFCIGDDNHISIYKSNKMPANLKPPGLGYHDKVEEFSIVQPSFASKNSLDVRKEIDTKNIDGEKTFFFNLDIDLDLKIKTTCIVEINEKYMAAAFYEDNCVKIFNMQDGFKEVISLPNKLSCEGNCILSVSKNREKLFVGCMEGFCIIYIDNFKKMTKFHLNQSILCLDIFNNEYMVVGSLKKDDYYIKQYRFKNEFKEISKFSESKIYSNTIKDVKIIKDKIFYLDDTNSIHYYKFNNIN
jgi:hypothetical protein